MLESGANMLVSGVATNPATSDYGKSRQRAINNNGNDIAELAKRKAETAGQEFEAMLLHVMLQPLFANSLGSDMFSGAGQHAWQDMLTEQYAAAMAESGGIGLADSVARELLDLQAVDHNLSND